MARFTITLSNGQTEEVSIPGSEDLSPQHLQELLDWSRQNSERRTKVAAEKKAYKKIPAIQAYHHMRNFQRWLAGEGKVF